MRLTLWLALFCFCTGLPPVSAQEYDIRMDRPVRAGEKFRMTAKGTAEEKSLIKMGDELVRDDRENFAIDFEATMTVLEVDLRQRPTKAQFVVSKCIKTEAYDQRPLIPPGAVVVAAVKDRESVFTVNGEPAGREAGQALDLVITLSKGGATDDEIFGTRSRKKVGDRWGINAELAAKELSDLKFKVTREALRGYDLADFVSLPACAVLVGIVVAICIGCPRAAFDAGRDGLGGDFTDLCAASASLAGAVETGPASG